MGFQEKARKIGDEARVGIVKEEKTIKESYHGLTQPRGRITLRR
jgi:hypothetical protein